VKKNLSGSWTWAQLGHHTKPCALLNARGFYDGLIAFLDKVTERGFLKGAHRSMLIVGQEPMELIERLRAYQPPAVAKWITAGKR
jgi:predicted Rossmann-fold nucleotide-binding protein